MNEPDDLFVTLSITKGGISSITRVIELTDRLAQARNTCEAHENKYETGVSRLMDIAALHSLLQKKTENTYARASGAVILLATFL